MTALAEVLIMRRILLIATTLMIGFLSVDGVLAQPKLKLRPLHIALANHSVTMAAIYVAKHQGIF